MKKILFLAVFASISVAATAQSLKVSFKFLNIVEGYDHECRMVVYVDSLKIHATDGAMQSKGGKFEVDLPKGEHTIRVVNEANYEGNWEEHTIENDYSHDCLHEFHADLKKKSKVKLDFIFDIDAGVTADLSVDGVLIEK